MRHLLRMQLWHRQYDSNDHASYDVAEPHAVNIHGRKNIYYSWK